MAESIAVSMRGPRWKSDALKELTRKYEKKLKEFEDKKRSLRTVFELSKTIITLLCSRPISVSLTGRAVYVWTEDFKHAHDIAKGLKVRLKKSLDSTGINYKGIKDGILIVVWGIKRTPKYRVVWEEEIIKRKVPKLVCK